jgi:hypothetical protein
MFCMNHVCRGYLEVCSALYAFVDGPVLFFLDSPCSPPLENLVLQSFGGDFGLEDTANAPLPRLLQRLDLAVHALLLQPPRAIDLVLLLSHLCQLCLDGLEYVLELGVPHQPRVLAELLQQTELRQPRIHVFGARVRLLQRLGPLGAVCVRGRIGDLVAGGIYGGQLGGWIGLQAQVLLLDKMGIFGCVCRRGDQGRMEVGGVNAS